MIVNLARNIRFYLNLCYDMGMKLEKKQYLMIGVLFLSILVVYFLASYVVPRMFVVLTKAAPAYKVSVGNSKMIGENILAKADGIDKCVVNVYIMDSSDKGVPKKNVMLTGIGGIVPQNMTTDNSGKASFSITSSVEGQFELSGTVDGVVLPGRIKVTFRN